MHLLFRYILLIGPYILLFAGSYKADIWLPESEGQNIKVKITIPVLTANTASYTIPGYTYGMLSHIATTDIILHFTAAGDNGKKQPLIIGDNRSFRIRKAYDTDYLQYEINPQTISYLNREEELSPISWLPGSYFFGEMSFLLGYINNSISQSYEIIIHHPTSWQSLLHSDKISSSTPGSTVIRVDGYEALADMPLLFGLSETLTAYPHFKLIQCGNTKKENTEMLLRAIVPLSEDLQRILPPDSAHLHRQIFIWNDQIRGRKQGKISGISYQGQSLLFINADHLTEGGISKLQKITAHEWFHLLTPGKLFSDRIHHRDVADRASSMYWFYEGLPEYLASKFLVSRSYWNEETYINDFSAKVKNYLSSPAINISAASRQNGKGGSLMPYYNEGALLCWILDLYIMQKTDDRLNLWKSLAGYVMELDGHPFEEDAFIADLSRHSSTDLTAIYNKYINDKKRIPFDDFIGFMGWEYAKETRISKGSYGQFMIIPNTGFSGFYFDKVGDNSIELMTGDILLAVNGEETTHLNYKLHLQWLKQPEPGRKIHLEVSRQGRKLMLYGTAFDHPSYCLHCILPRDKPRFAEDVFREKFFLQDFSQPIP